MATAQAAMEHAWMDKRCRDQLSDAYRSKGERPERVATYFQVCWALGFPEWHGLIDVDLLDDDQTATEIYRQFAREGPTPCVVGSMCVLSRSLASDKYVEPMLRNIIKKNLAQGATEGVLKLWRRYAPKGLHRDVVLALSREFGGPLRVHAARAAEALYDSDAKWILPQLSLLASCRDSTDKAGHVARRIVRSMSNGRYSLLIAREVQKVPFHPYVNRLHLGALWSMLKYLRQSGAVDALTKLYNSWPWRAVLEGVYTYLLELGAVPDPYSPFIPLVQCVHTSLYFSRMTGESVKRFMHSTMRQHPKAVACLARFHPRSNYARECRWQRRKLLIMCFERQMGPTSAVGRFMHGRPWLLRMVAAFL